MIQPTKIDCNNKHIGTKKGIKVLRLLTKELSVIGVKISKTLIKIKVLRMTIGKDFLSRETLAGRIEPYFKLKAMLSIKVKHEEFKISKVDWLLSGCQLKLNSQKCDLKNRLSAVL